MTAADIAGRLRLARDRQGMWRGACPACGYGKDAFVLGSRRDGSVWGWCASCGDKAAIARVIGGGPATGVHASQTTEQDEAKAARQTERALAIWNGSIPAVGTPAALYLQRRGLPDLAHSPALRFRPDTSHPDGSKRPAMVALVTAADGTPVAVHRTYIRQDGTKADVEPVKASLGPVKGGAIRLSEVDPNGPLVLAEGIETAASAGLLMEWPAWAAVSAGNLANGLALPAEARLVAIAVDPDPAGRRAAQAAWNRLRAEGRDVTMLTPAGDGDFNDLWVARLARDASR